MENQSLNQKINLNCQQIVIQSLSQSTSSYLYQLFKGCWHSLAPLGIGNDHWELLIESAPHSFQWKIKV